MMLSSSANGHSQSQPQWTPSHRASQSSISSLSQPLSPALTARLQASFLWAGLQDALKFKKALDSIQLDPVIRAAVTKCTLLQLFILICVTGVDWLLLPTWTRGSAAAAATSSGRQRISEEQARFYFQIFWLGPLMAISFLLSGSFFTNVAARAGSASGMGADVPMVSGKRGGSGTSSGPKASLISRMALIVVYLITSGVLSRIPYLGRPASFLYLSLVSSYYCFEYRFLSSFSLFSLRSRVQFLEARWPYFIGFGLPSTILSSAIFSSATLNLTIWSLLFPLCLLLAAHADPVPYDADKPAKSHDLPGQEGNSERGTTRFASRYLNPEVTPPPWWPRRCWVLHPAVLLDDVIAGFISSFMRGGRSAGPKKSAEGYSGPGAGVQYGAAAYAGGMAVGSGPGAGAYAQRRDAFASRTGAGPGASGFGMPSSSSYTHAAGMAASSLANTASGFARQADEYFGNLASGNAAASGIGASKPPPPRRERSENYGVGLAGGVATRREGMEGGVSSRRRGAGGADGY